jgi:hypothetical protein
MHIDVKIPGRLDGQVEQTVNGEVGQHVVEKSNPGRNFMFAYSIQV